MFRFMKKETGRRGFLKESGRIILGSGLLVMAAVFGSRKENPDAAAPCQLSLPCNGCRQLSACIKEQASVFKQQQEPAVQDSRVDEGVNRSGR